MEYLNRNERIILKLKINVLLDAGPDIPVKTYQCLVGIYCLHLLEGGGRRFLKNLVTYQTARRHILEAKSSNLNYH
jgi:hypothetical protein